MIDKVTVASWCDVRSLLKTTWTTAWSSDVLVPDPINSATNRLYVRCRRSAPFSLLFWNHPFRGPFLLRVDPPPWRQVKVNEIGHRGVVGGQDDIFWLSVTMDDRVPLITMQIGYGTQDPSKISANGPGVSWSCCTSLSMMVVCKFMSNFSMTIQRSRSPSCLVTAPWQSQMLGWSNVHMNFASFHDAQKHCWIPFCNGQHVGQHCLNHNWYIYNTSILGWSRVGAEPHNAKRTLAKNFCGHAHSVQFHVDVETRNFPNATRFTLCHCWSGHSCAL